ncbi:sodium:proton antiporter [Bradyrhizobium sp. LHD-71]|uniref:cation:proton antiporter n=1 Tax=Bradyrhizobium sp. LHD-71 TaxID=3072141 RepID=UPI00280F69A8|nr:sodium:proton antiporter [Bradyrhizobium sp. LHD-71]MDQ8726956.1 sodium:proton antiporter [Bradyrhizobium sp. LHD-71]
MTTFEWIIGLLLGAILLSAIARRLNVPYPTFLALGGAGLAFLPVAPEWTLEPELALALFVAPVLLDAAYDTSLRDLRDNWLAVSTLVVIAVGVTTASVAVVVHWLVPAMPWAAAVALGAIVAPPDAAAATAILRQVRIPHRLLKILEGESLLNDASALLIYRVAVGAVAVQSLEVSEIAPSVLIALVGSPVAGYLFAKLTARISARIEDPPSAVIMQFANTFLVWIVAENLGLSAILTIVVYAVTIARTAPGSTPARIRVPSYAVWETAVFVLNVLAFVLIGMQLRPILGNLPQELRMDYLAVAGAVLLTVIAVRLVWVMAFNTGLRMYIARYGFHPRRPVMRPSAQGGFLVAWCGMRGIVTLAAAFALPDGSAGSTMFPYRDLILLTAFVVVLGSLLIQGLTLGPLVRLLKMDTADPVAREVGFARGVAYRAALAAIDGDDSEAARLVRKEYQAVLSRSGADQGEFAESELPADPLRRRGLAAARQAILALRDADDIGDDAFHRLEEELDFAELNAGGRAA